MLRVKSEILLHLHYDRIKTYSDMVYVVRILMVNIQTLNQNTAYLLLLNYCAFAVLTILI
jgi:hypothetical protein